VIYFIWHPVREEIKIGYTADFYARLKQLNRAHHCRFEIRLVIPGHRRDEIRLHRRFQHLNVSDAPGREFFFPAPELLNFIAQYRLTTVAPESFIAETPTGVNDNAVTELVEPVQRTEVTEIYNYEPVAVAQRVRTAREYLLAAEMFLCPLPRLLGTAQGAKFCDIGLKLERNIHSLRLWLFNETST
jgi:hypothetical protein